MKWFKQMQEIIDFLLNTGIEDFFYCLNEKAGKVYIEYWAE